MNYEQNKILVVHTKRDVLMTVTEELERKGYQVIIATNGLDGMFLGYYEKFSMILAAFDLPKITGFEMIRTLQNRSYNSSTPVIFMGTGRESDEIKRIATSLHGTIIPESEIVDCINSVEVETKTYP